MSTGSTGAAAEWPAASGVQSPPRPPWSTADSTRSPPGTPPRERNAEGLPPRRIFVVDPLLETDVTNDEEDDTPPDSPSSSDDSIDYGGDGSGDDYVDSGDEDAHAVPWGTHRPARFVVRHEHRVKGDTSCVALFVYVIVVFAFVILLTGFVNRNTPSSPDTRHDAMQMIVKAAADLRRQVIAADAKLATATGDCVV